MRKNPRYSTASQNQGVNRFLRLPGCPPLSAAGIPSTVQGTSLRPGAAPRASWNGSLSGLFACAVAIGQLPVDLLGRRLRDGHLKAPPLNAGACLLTP
jgi:hypothetical protein